MKCRHGCQSRGGSSQVKFFGPLIPSSVMGIVLILCKCKFTKHCFLYWFLFIDLFIILFIICSISDSKTYSHNADCLKSKAVPRAFLTWRIQYSVFSFFSTSRHPAVGLKREQKRDHISARHRGEVLIS